MKFKKVFEKNLVNYFGETFTIKKISLASILMALAIVLSIFGRFIIVLPIFGQLRISFTIIVLIGLGFVINPFLGFIAGILVDVLSFFIGATPGTFHFGFSFNAGLTCFLSSFFCRTIKVNNEKNHYQVFWYILVLLIVCVNALLILEINPLSLKTWILGVTSFFTSLACTTILYFLILWKKNIILQLVFLVFLINIINTALSSIWLNNLFSIKYEVLLWPRLIKNSLIDWWVILLVVTPFFYIVKKKNYLWHQGIKSEK